MKLKKYMAAILLGGIMASCDSFLTQPPYHSLTQDNAVRDYNGAKNVVNGIYGKFASSISTSCSGQMYGYMHCMAGLWKYSEKMYNMGYTQTNYSADAWKGFYACINAANAAISTITPLDEKLFPSPAEKKHLLGEAYCFRGYCNLHLLWLFGHWFETADSPYGIIYRDKVAELTNLQVGRSTVGESYQYILDDLKFAEENCADYSSAMTMSKQLAQILHAKLLMVRGWEGDYAEALTIVNDIFATAPETFKMETDLAKLYEDAWDSKEVLFTRYLGDFASTTSYEFTYSYGLYYDKSFTDVPQEWLEADPRAAIVLGEARSPETWDERREDKVLVKLYHRGRVEGKADKYASYVFRYPELYLMKAELLARTNPSDIQGALKPLNDMRAAYTNPVLEPVTGITTHDELMDAIYKEYVVTLLMENETPWFASLRFNHNGQPWIKTLKPDVNFSENQYCWPIPDSEIISHTNKIEQNPGLN